MKKISTFTLCLFVVASAFGGQQTSKITGNITDLPDGTEVAISRPIDPQTSRRLETKKVDGGRFVFEVPVDSLTRFRLMSNSKLLSVWLEPGKDAVITGSGDLIWLWDVESDVQRQKESNQFHEIEKPFEQKIDSIRNAIKTLKEQAAQNSDMVDLIRLQTRTLEAEEEAVDRAKAQAQIDLIRHIPVNDEVMDKIFWLSKYLRLEYFGIEEYREDIVSIYEALPEKYKNSDKGKEIYGNLFGPGMLKIGDSVPELETFNLVGKSIKLTDFKGKYILVDVWSRGCGPCMSAFPEMKKLSEKYDDRLVIVSMSMDSKMLWEKTSEEQDITWENLNDSKGEQGLVAYFYSGAIPAYTLVDPQGVIIKQWTGYGTGSLEKELAKVLDK